MSRTGFLVGLALTLPPPTAQAQEPTIPLGTKVRIESTLDRKLNGVLLVRDVDSITVERPSGTRTTVPTASVLRIRVPNGRSHMAGAARGAKVGTITGTALIGAVYLVSLGKLNEDDFEIMPVFLLVGAGYGAAIGSLIGVAVGAERWTTVYGRTVRVSYRPLSSGRGVVGLTIR